MSPSGTNASLQLQIQSLLNDYVATGEEVGLQVAVYHRGQLIVDAWSGMAAPEKERRVSGETIFASWSTTKGLAAAAVHHLVARRILDYDTPLVEFWPEYGCHGKEKTTVRHVLIHAAGVPQLPHLEDVTQFLDWDAMCAAVAKLEPLWEPGTAVGYHAVTMGWLVGETVRRISGQPIDEYLRQHIFSPLNIDSCFLGVPESELHRIAPLQFEEAPPLSPGGASDEPAPASAPSPAPSHVAPAETHTRERGLPEEQEREGEVPLAARTMPADALNLRHMNDRRAQMACLPASGGIMSARGLARFYALFAGHGTLDGTTLFTPEHVDRIRALQTDEVDRVFERPHRKALGYMLGGDPERGGDLAKGDRGGEFGHGGLGGSNGYADPERQVAVGLTKNLVKQYPSRPPIAVAVSEAVRHHVDGLR